MVSNQFAMPGGLFIEEEGINLKLMIPIGKKAAMIFMHCPRFSRGLNF